MILIRQARPDDVPAMSAILTASITQLCTADHGGASDAIAAWTRNKSEAGVSLMLANPELEMFVAERDRQMVGVGAVNRNGSIGLNYVDPTARFSGVSKALLAQLETTLRQLGFDEGRLESTLTARSFYLSQGWHEAGPQGQGRLVNGYPMRKRVLAV